MHALGRAAVSVACTLGVAVAAPVSLGAPAHASVGRKITVRITGTNGGTDERNGGLGRRRPVRGLRRHRRPGGVRRLSHRTGLADHAALRQQGPARHDHVRGPGSTRRSGRLAGRSRAFRDRPLPGSPRPRHRARERRLHGQHAERQRLALTPTSGLELGGVARTTIRPGSSATTSRHARGCAAPTLGAGSPGARGRRGGRPAARRSRALAVAHAARRSWTWPSRRPPTVSVRSPRSRRRAPSRPGSA